jgi:hypothetical protein
MPVEVLLDGQMLTSLVVRDDEIMDAVALFGPDLGRLAGAKSLVVTAEIADSKHTIYEADLSGTDAALAKMRAITNHDYHQPQPGNAPSSCFLTTACCGMVGLSDDCFELTMLRRFRDRVMLRTAAGRRDVERYYECAPAILAAMRARGETGRLRGLYFGTILPSAILIRLGFDGPARRLYTRMMLRLEARYG